MDLRSVAVCVVGGQHKSTAIRLVCEHELWLNAGARINELLFSELQHTSLEKLIGFQLRLVLEGLPKFLLESRSDLVSSHAASGKEEI